MRLTGPCRLGAHTPLALSVLIQPSQGTHFFALHALFFDLFCWRTRTTSLLEGLGVSAHLPNPSPHLEFASQEPWRCLVRAPLPPGSALCCTASEVTYSWICCLENHLLITSVITPVSSWPRRSGESSAFHLIREAQGAAGCAQSHLV